MPIRSGSFTATGTAARAASFASSSRRTSCSSNGASVAATHASARFASTIAAPASPKARARFAYSSAVTPAMLATTGQGAWAASSPTSGSSLSWPGLWSERYAGWTKGCQVAVLSTIAPVAERASARSSLAVDDQAPAAFIVQNGKRMPAMVVPRSVGRRSVMGARRPAQSSGRRSSTAALAAAGDARLGVGTGLALRGARYLDDVVAQVDDPVLGDAGRGVDGCLPH